MKKYILNRLISMIIVLFIVATLTFFLAKAIPGGPFTKEKKVPDAVLKNLEKNIILMLHYGNNIQIICLIY